MEINQKRCDNCINYQKVSKKSGTCETNVIPVFVSPLFDKTGKELKFHIKTRCSDFCELFVEK